MHVWWFKNRKSIYPKKENVYYWCLIIIHLTLVVCWQLFAPFWRKHLEAWIYRFELLEERMGVTLHDVTLLWCWQQVCNHWNRRCNGFIWLHFYKHLTSSLLGVKQKIPGKIGILALLVEGNGLTKDFFHKSSIKIIYNAKICIYKGFLFITNLFEIITWSWI